MFRRFIRGLKYKFLVLMRNKGASTVIARSFAIGMFIEFITLPTMGLAFLLLFPLVRFTRSLFSVALVGFATGKLLIPLFLVFNYKVGYFFVHTGVGNGPTLQATSFFSWEAFKEKGLAFLTGSGVNGVWVALIFYAVVYWAIGAYRKRKETLRQQRSLAIPEQTS